ncbi:MAG: hypothetical protein ACQEWV_26215 [Bacillota bacterium]
MTEESSKKIPVNLKIEEGLLNIIDSYKKETFYSTRTDAIKDLCKFALHKKGYLDKI